MEDILKRVGFLNPGLNLDELKVHKLETGEYVIIPTDDSNMYQGMVGVTFTVKE